MLYSMLCPSTSILHLPLPLFPPGFASLVITRSPQSPGPPFFFLSENIKDPPRFEQSLSFFISTRQSSERIIPAISCLNLLLYLSSLSSSHPLFLFSFNN